MRALTCTTVQLWLQAPDAMEEADAARVETHMQHCPACAEERDALLMADRLIVQSLNVRAATTTVRPRVMAAVRVEHERRQTRVTWRRRLGLHMSVRQLQGMVALCAVVAIVSALAPRALPDGKTQETLGAGWHLLRTDIGFPLAIDPTRPSHLLAGASGQVYQSFNAGATWRRLAPLPPRQSVRAVVIDSMQPSRYLVAVRNSVYVSRDAGKHWTVTVNSLPGSMNMFMIEDRTTPGTFYLGPSILWKSTNHGDTWSPAGPGTVFAPDGIQALTVAPGGMLLTGIWHGGVARSTDRGVTWQRRAQGLAPNVLGVTVAGSTVWAATDHGLFSSVDGGLHWRQPVGLEHFYATTVAASAGVLVAAGNGAVYRSTDGGGSWQLAMHGLPIDPYVNTVMSDPVDSRRMYASLDADGVFRSDDGGATWHSISTGLPLSPRQDVARVILFRRGGALWNTDDIGTDPAVMTVDTDVRLAALAPDGAAAVYLAVGGDAWSVRLLSARGSTAHTLKSGTGSPPTQLRWSPSSSMLAVRQVHEMTLMDLTGKEYRWSTGAERPMRWSVDGRSLYFWDAVSHRVVARAWRDGVIVQRWPGTYPKMPVSAPDGVHLAYVYQGELFAGSWTKGMHPITRVPPGSRVTRWSNDSSRFLLAGHQWVEERSAAGHLLVWTALPRGTTWVPGSHTDLMFYRNGSLWRWSASGMRAIVPHAESVSNLQSPY